jgi:hypothetical protein
MEVRIGRCACAVKPGLVVARHTQATIVGGRCAWRLEGEANAHDPMSARHPPRRSCKSLVPLVSNFTKTLANYTAPTPNATAYLINFGVAYISIYHTNRCLW